MNPTTKTRQLIVFGGASVQQDKNKQWLTKSAFASYLNELSQHYQRVVFWGVEDSHSSIKYESLVDKSICVFSMKIGPIKTSLIWLKLLYQLNHSTDIIIHLPNGAYLRPIISFIKHRARKTTVYLASDFEYWAKLSSASRIPGATNCIIEFQRSILASADLVFARGKYLQGLASKYNHNVELTLPINGLNYLNFAIPAENDYIPIRIFPCFIVISKLEWTKGFKDLLLCFQKLKAKYPDFRCNILGDGKDSDAIQNEAQDLKLDENIRFHGWVDSKSKTASFWAQSDLHIVSSRESEGVPRTIDEAFYFRVPTIATAVGGIPFEFQNNEVHLVPAENSNAMCQAICDLLENPKIRIEMLNKSERRIESFRQWGTAANQHATIIFNT